MNLVRARFRRFRLIAFPPEMPPEFLSGKEREEWELKEQIEEEKRMTRERYGAIGMRDGCFYIKDPGRYFQNIPDLTERLDMTEELIEESITGRVSRQRDADSAASQTPKGERVFPRGGGALIVYN